LRVEVRIQPKASRDEVIEQPDGTLKVKTTAPPVKGAANRACMGLLAEYFGVRKSDIRIVSGFTSRNKVIEIEKTQC
jgi:hypothetical protein